MQVAGAFSDYRHKPPLSQEVFKAIKPVYDDLSRDELLNRCLGGFTQNSKTFRPIRSLIFQFLNIYKSVFLLIWSKASLSEFEIKFQIWNF